MNNDLSICFEFMDYPQTNKEIWQNFMLDYSNQAFDEHINHKTPNTVEEYLLDRYDARLIAKIMSFGTIHCYKSTIITFETLEHKTEFIVRYT